MGKITFRADDELVTALESFDASKSEVLREALRSYLESTEDPQSGALGASSTKDESRSLDDIVRERVDEIIERRLDEHRSMRDGDVNVTVALEGADTVGKPVDKRSQESSTEADTKGSKPRPERKRSDSGDVASDESNPCAQCGEPVQDDHVYCPNCGEQTSRRLFCECGDEIRSDWSFCPGCGRRTPAADVLDSTIT